LFERSLYAFCGTSCSLLSLARRRPRPRLVGYVCAGAMGATVEVSAGSPTNSVGVSAASGADVVGARLEVSAGSPTSSAGVSAEMFVAGEVGRTPGVGVHTPSAAVGARWSCRTAIPQMSASEATAKITVGRRRDWTTPTSVSGRSSGATHVLMGVLRRFIPSPLRSRFRFRFAASGSRR
jgi:hypothetical protein